MADERNTTARTLAVFTAAALLLGTWLPLLSGPGRASVADGGKTIIVYVLITAGLILIGAFAQWRSAPLLAAGAAIAAGGVMLFLDTLSYAIIDAFDGFDSDTGIGGGMVCLAIFAVLSVLLLALGIRGADRTTQIPAGPYTALGVISAAGITLGAMLPPTGTGLTFARLNFDWDPWYVQIAWLTYVGALGLAGVIGFTSKHLWGITLAFAGIIPTTWLVTSSLDDNTSGDQVTNLFEKVHPVLIIAIITNLAMMLWARGAATATTPRATTRSTTTVTGTNNTSGSNATTATGTPTATGAATVTATARWAPDPDGRHQLRYHDGRRWTANVSDYGVQSTDPPGPIARWAPDPFGRHELRYHDGRIWTRHVSNDGVVTGDPPGYAPPPSPGHITETAGPPTPRSTRDVAGMVETAEAADVPPAEG